MNEQECTHIPQKLRSLNKNSIVKNCKCKQFAECVCATCLEPLCEMCREKHEHPVSCGTKGGYCIICKKDIEKEKVLKLYESLPAFLPPNAKGFALFLKYKNPQKVVVMAGAGISTSAGIPDFRTPGTGLYDNLEKYQLPFPEAVFDIDYFKKDPQPFYTIASELMPGLGKYFPTPTHHFITYLNKLGYISMFYTQNIDGLEIQSGFPNDKLIMAHGNYYSAHCTQCNKLFQQTYFVENVRNGIVCHCDKCNGVIKPDIVFFGENLPKEFFHNFDKVQNCDLLIVLGTSLVVHPFASLVDIPSVSTPRVFINLTNIDDFNTKDDLKLLGKCDDIVFEIVEYMGIGDDFKNYVEDKK